MSTALKPQGLAAIGVLALLLAASPASSREAPVAPKRLATIADCPPGYTLGVRDLAEPQPLARPPVNEFEEQPRDEHMDANNAPRQFITGCVPPPNQTPQPRY